MIKNILRLAGGLLHQLEWIIFNVQIVYLLCIFVYVKIAKKLLLFYKNNCIFFNCFYVFPTIYSYFTLICLITFRILPHTVPLNRI